MKTPDPLTTMAARAKASRLPQPSRASYEIRICTSCDHETAPRPWGEVPCICGGREFEVVPLERQPARRAHVPATGEATA